MTKAERLERDINKLAEMKAHENELRAQGYRCIAGIDEVGRGPLAGPVYAACVVLPEDWDIPGVNDSKKLSAKRREELSEIIKERAVAYGIGVAEATEIDTINILEATKEAMKRAIDDCNEVLTEKDEAVIDMLLIDAVKLDTGIPYESIIKGDEKSLSIAAASIIAKVARDNFMTEMDAVYPGYDFASNKGYGTAKHYEGLRTIGYTPIHRRSFLKKFEEEQTSGRIAWGAAGISGKNGETVRSDACISEDSKSKGTDDLAKGKKIYAVKKGKTTGIFMTWEDCKAQVDGFPGAEYKSFADASDAMAYLGIAETETEEHFPEGVRAYVDGSYDASDGRFSCGVVMVRTDSEGNVKTCEFSEAYDDPEAAKQRNVAGEIMGSKTAIDFCLTHGIDAVTIYHDYEGIGKWADGLWKAKNPLTQKYSQYVAKARTRIDITFVKVKAHAGNKYNELADKLAKDALKA